ALRLLRACARVAYFDSHLLLPELGPRYDEEIIAPGAQSERRGGAGPVRVCLEARRTGRHSCCSSRLLLLQRSSVALDRQLIGPGFSLAIRGDHDGERGIGPGREIQARPARVAQGDAVVLGENLLAGVVQENEGRIEMRTLHLDGVRAAADQGEFVRLE